MKDKKQRKKRVKQRHQVKRCLRVYIGLNSLCSDWGRWGGGGRVEEGAGKGKEEVGGGCWEILYYAKSG